MTQQKTGQKALKPPSKRGSRPESAKPSLRVSSRQISEKEIHLLAWQWIRETYPDLLIFHVPSGEQRNVVTAVKLKRMGVVPGVADFLMFVPGIGVAIELKNKGGMQSKAQEHFQKRWEACGNRYIIAYSFDEFKTIVGKYVWPWTKRGEP